MNVRSLRLGGYFTQNLISLRSDRTSETVNEAVIGRRRPKARFVIPVYSMQNQPLNLEACVASSTFDSVEAAISRHLANVGEASAVYFLKEGDVINIWTVLKNYNRATRRKVYEQEAKIIRELPELPLYFRTTDLEGEEIPKSELYNRIDLEELRRDAAI